MIYQILTDDNSAVGPDFDSFEAALAYKNEHQVEGRIASRAGPDEINLGDSVEVTSYGQAIRGTVTQIGRYTGKPSQMLRWDNNKLRAIVPPGNCRKVD